MCKGATLFSFHTLTPPSFSYPCYIWAVIQYSYLLGVGDHFQEHIKFLDFSIRAGKDSTILQTHRPCTQLLFNQGWCHRFKSGAINNMQVKRAEKNWYH